MLSLVTMAATSSHCYRSAGLSCNNFLKSFYILVISEICFITNKEHPAGLVSSIV